MRGDPPYQQRCMYVYELRLKGGRHYVGTTTDPAKRLRQHQARSGPAWTRIHHVEEGGYATGALSRMEDARHARLREDSRVKELMIVHGMASVRGGSYSNVDLTPTQVAALNLELRHASGVCMRCGEPGHWASSCVAHVRSELPHPPSPLPPMKSSMVGIPFVSLQRLMVREYRLSFHEAPAGGGSCAPRAGSVCVGILSAPAAELSVLYADNDGSVVAKLANALDIHADEVIEALISSHDASTARSDTPSLVLPWSDRTSSWFMKAVISQKGCCAQCNNQLTDGWVDAPRVNSSGVVVCAPCANSSVVRASIVGTVAPWALEAAEQTVFSFGKHIGSAVRDVDSKYLDWLVSGGGKVHLDHSDRTQLLLACGLALASRTPIIRL